ncbi:MAG: MFS transporter [Clostridiales Family XIII bacterium]|jgi:EmrB/QacA subfamily drug resistance transporter|nr:MFS transporter [Clostridiales Family XIII bacterium]
MTKENSEKPALGDRQRAVVFVIVFSSFLPSFAGSALNVAVPVIGHEFHSSAASLGWIVTAYMISTVTLMLPIGRLSDLTSKRRVLIVGLSIFSVVSGSCMFAGSLGMLIVLRVLNGIGSACMFATAQAILVDAVPREMRGRALGMSVSSVYVGLSAGPVLGGLITHYLGWRWMFVIISCVGFVTVAVAIAKLPEKPRAPREGSLLSQLDGGGTAIYMVAIVALMYGFSSVARNAFAVPCLLVGLGLLVCFFLYEHRSRKPLLNLRLFRGNPNFLLSNLAALLNYGATFTMAYLLSLYLQLVGGFGADRAGMVLIAMPVMQAVVSVFAGRLSDRRSPFKLASFGMALCASGLVSFIFLGDRASLPHIVPTLMLMGVGFGFFSSPNTNAIMSLASPQDYGIVSSFVGTMRNFGQSLGMCVITVIMGHNLGNVPIEDSPPDLIVLSIRSAYIAFACICTVGIFISLGRKENAPGRGHSDLAD